ncbi:MAG: helix-turn-helix domain-containing protein [Chiayiivirga sp.]|jgi:cytoskeleton protein RodZ|uniref:helix-turn-helix domain-containing protein n=1 Tax=Chiayiivirga sp. TaxID=2041042 RepID=UPI0025C323DD|nr:helix-turn-helix domain-containing protein [Chiayiivirga sp.]MCI1709764.1 helix-turn-helix domain-containing protein [Chiayiivirga sp.]MCI1729930.1 helix-turn-helix domain-containing protein [Chiayiivirga sp.]
MTPVDEQSLHQSGTDLPLGLRLRRAREARKLSVGEAAEKLRLKSATIEALEREDFDALGAPVYVRGYFSSYARLLDVPAVLVDGLFTQRAAPPPQLHTTARVSHSRYLFDRYAKRAVYVVLTASIVVPTIYLATMGRLPSHGASLTPLDAPNLTIPLQVATTEPASDAAAADDVGPPAPLARAGDSPVMAGLGPFLPSQFQPQSATPPVAPIAAPSGLSLHLNGDSWVEVLDAEGRRIEHGILRAGETRDFAPGTAVRVSLGNAEAVEVRVNGSVTDIAAYRRANVARFTVSSDGSLAPAGG